MGIPLLKKNIPARISDFEIGELLGQGATSSVYRASRDGQSYAIKLIRGADQSIDGELHLRFRQEAAAIARLNHPSLVKVVEFGEQDSHTYLVMELIEGERLDAFLARSGPLTEDRLVELAKHLAGALGEVHKKSFIHRDIKPANIMLDSSGRPRMIDFGFATRGDRQASGETHPDDRALGTPLYSAPEQSGVLRRPVDARSDLYSFGAVLFECAAGRPPFEASSAAELMLKHLNVIPADVSACNPTIRPVFSALVKKLLSKDPDDRYQSAQGLLYDLEHLSEINSPAELGTRDTSLSFSGDIPLVGRQDDLDRLKARWHQVIQGQGAVVQIEGEGGSGKTRLTQELVSAIRASGKALLLFGKFQQSERTPFGALREAIDDHVTWIHRLPEADREAELQRIRVAAGEFGAIVRRLTRSLDRVFEGAAELVPLDPANEQNRFYEKVADFFLGLAASSGGAALLVDDIQWVDDGSLEVLKKIAARIDAAPLLIATTARNDAASEEAKQAFISDMGDALKERIVLKPLTSDAVHELIAAHLGGKRLEDASVVFQLNSKANGNPFAIGQYVRSMLEQGVLQPTLRGWAVDQEGFRKVALPADVTELLIGRIARLSDTTASVLSQAAVIGFEFSAELLSKLTAGGPESLGQAFTEAVQGNLIEKYGENFRFVHDRIYEALIKRLKSEERRDIHQALAELLDHTDAGPPGDVYAVATHYARGHVHKTPRRAYEANFRAGTHALEKFSNEEAFELLEAARDFAETAQVPAKEQRLLLENLGVTCTRTGRLQLAHAYFDRALKLTASREDLNRVYFLIGQTYASEGKNAEAWSELQRALGMLGAALPKNVIGQALTLLWHWASALLRSRFGWGFGTAKAETRERRQRISAIHNIGNFQTYFLGKAFLMMQNVVRELHNVQYLGISRETAKAHAFYTVLMGMLGRAKSVDRHGRIAVNIARQIGDLETLAYCEFYYACGIEMAGDIVRSMPLIRKVRSGVEKYCMAWESAGLHAFMVYSNYFQGDTRKAVEVGYDVAPAIDRSGCVNLQIAVHGALYSQQMLLGRTQEALAARKRLVQLLGDSRDKMQRCYFHGNEILVALDREDLGAEVEKHVEAFLATNYDDYHTRMSYVLIGYVRLEQMLRESDAGLRARAVEKLRRQIRVAGFPRAITPVHACHLLVLRAALALEYGRHAKCGRLLARAERLAQQTGSHWGRWAVSRQRARMHLLLKDERSSNDEARVALEVAQKQGWVNRAACVRREFALDESLRKPSVSSSTLRSEASSVSTRALDALLKVSLASAQVINPDEQAILALDELVKVLSAERAYLFLSLAGSEELEMKCGRDSDGKALTALQGYSTTVVDQVRRSREPMIVSGTDQGEALGSESIVGNNLRSIMATPLVLREKLVGVLYLDSKVIKGLFTEEDLDLLAAIGNHVAISIETAKAARLEIQRQALEKDNQAKKAIQLILDNLDQGFMTFDSSGVIQEGISAATHRLFKADPRGKTLSELLRTDGPGAHTLRDWVGVLFEELIPFESMKEAGPKSFEKVNGEYIELDYRPIRAPDQKIEKVILIATDKTQERALQAKAKAEESLSRLVISVLKNRQAFARFVQDTRQCIAALKGGGIDLSEARRMLHSVKGCCALYHVDDVKDLVHRMETELSAPAVDLSLIPAKGVELEKRFEDFLDRHRYIFGSPGQSGERELVLPASRVYSLAGKIARRLGSDSPEWREFRDTLILAPIEGLFDHYENAVAQVAGLLAKQVRFELVRSGLRVWRQKYEPLTASLVHAFRNAVDHGIESPAERASCGKPEQGTVQVTFAERRASGGEGRLVIRIRDDGRGIDPELIGKLAVKRGVLTDSQLQALGPHERMQLVFAPGFSSKSQVSDLSGRGVGLDAIDSEAKKLSGRAWVESTPGMGTDLFVEVPMFREPEFPAA